MSEATCAVLTAVFPIVLIATLLEGRFVSAHLRKTNSYTWTVGFGSMLSLVGIVLSVVGVQLTGWQEGMAVFAWTIFVASLLCLFVIILLLALSFDSEDGRGTAIFGRRPVIPSGR